VELVSIEYENNKSILEYFLLVPTLRVGTHVRPLRGPILSAEWALDATRSVATVRSHAERGNEEVIRARTTFFSKIFLTSESQPR